MTNICCTPARDSTSEGADLGTAARGPATVADAVEISGGKTRVGTDAPQIPDDGEGPARTVVVQPFRIAPTAVSNAEFRVFVKDTGYVTEAERFG